MSRYSQNAFKVRLHVITPVHIGCDDAYEPTGFVVDRANKKLIAFDPVDFVHGLDGADRLKFLSICEKGTLNSLIELYKFMDGRKTTVQGRCVGVTDGFLASYDRVIKLPPNKEHDIKQELNKFMVARTSYLPLDSTPYIPGSALKGALRTGWLNHLHRGVLTKVDGKRAKGFEKQLLKGDFAADPFRLLKVSDLLPVEQPETMIRFAVNKKKKPSKFEARGPQQILEVVSHGQHAVFEGMITLTTPEEGASITAPIPADEQFFQQTAVFFQNEMAMEETMLRGIAISADIENKFRQNFGDRYLKSVFPVRLGRHSGAEAVTIKGVRSIKIMGKKGEPPQYGPAALTTWLAGDTPKATSGLLPFGWAALELCRADPAALWPERKIATRLRSAHVGVPGEPITTPTAPTITTETLVWENALLVWTPGNATITTTGVDGKKAMVKLASDKSIVPEALHKSVFDKKKATPAKVTVQKEGNLLQIFKIEPV
jgi:CRISPR-associated protein Csm5